jgi:hypothetical protein
LGWEARTGKGNGRARGWIHEKEDGFMIQLSSLLFFDASHLGTVVVPAHVQTHTNPTPRFWDSFWKKIRSQPNWMNFGLNSVKFRNVKHKICFGPHRNGRISPKFGLIRSNPGTLPYTRTPRVHKQTYNYTQIISRPLWDHQVHLWHRRRRARRIPFADDVPCSPEPAQLTHPTRPEGTIQAGRGPSPILTSYS